jgi:hypothetical protein
MATVQGIRERIGQPIIDALRVPPGKQLREVEPGSTLKFFVNVQGKTKLETNLQSASLLPHYNTFEARTMRVVISDLPPEFSDQAQSKGKSSEGFPVTDEDGNAIDSTGQIEGATGSTFDDDLVVTANLKFDLKRLMELLGEVRESQEKEKIIEIRAEGVTLRAEEKDLDATQIDNVDTAGGLIILTVTHIEALIESMEKLAPPLEQIRPNDGAGNIVSKLIFNTVTTLFVGEKIMTEGPTFLFPGGAGPYSFTNNTISHGEPSPLATFRFAEPVFIDKQQNFRVEIDIPDSDVHKTIQQIYGPLFIWVVLDGYLTRDVQ